MVPKSLEVAGEPWLADEDSPSVQGRVPRPFPLFPGEAHSNALGSP